MNDAEQQDTELTPLTICRTEYLDRFLVLVLFTAILVMGFWVDYKTDHSRQMIDRLGDRIDSQIEVHHNETSHPYIRAHIDQIEDRLKDLDDRNALVWPQQREPRND